MSSSHGGSYETVRLDVSFHIKHTYTHALTHSTYTHAHAHTHTRTYTNIRENKHIESLIDTDRLMRENWHMYT